jgi:ABC-type Fe3+ transport system permease subunit
MTGYGHTSNAGQEPATPGSDLSPTTTAKNLMINGWKIFAVGAVGLILGILAMVAVSGKDFPFARFIALLVLFVLVITAVVAVRGLVWLLQGLVAYIRAPK